MSLHVAHWPEGVPGIPVDPDDAEDWIASWVGISDALERVPQVLAFAAAQAIRDKYPAVVGPFYRAGGVFGPAQLAMFNITAGELPPYAAQVLSCALNGDGPMVEALTLAAVAGDYHDYWFCVGWLLAWVQS